MISLAVGLMDDSVLYSEQFILLGDSGSYLTFHFYRQPPWLGLACSSWPALQAAVLMEV